MIADFVYYEMRPKLRSPDVLRLENKTPLKFYYKLVNGGIELHLFTVNDSKDLILVLELEEKFWFETSQNQL